MIHQFFDNESEIMVNNESYQQPVSGRKYELCSCQVPISAPRKQNLGRKMINQPTPLAREFIPIPNQLQPKKLAMESRDVLHSILNLN